MGLPLVSMMIVEAEPALRRTIVRLLEGVGFAVTPAESGERAVALLERKNSSYRAVITDVRLARGEHSLTGWDVAHRARELNPELPIIYITGGSGVDWAAHGVPKSVLLCKPFARTQIIAAISHLLNETG